MDNKQKQTEEMENSALLVAWEFSEKEKPFVSIFIKKNDGIYIEHTSNKGEGYFILKGYRKQSDTAREILHKLINNIIVNNTIDGYLSESIDYSSTINDIKELAAEYGVEVEE